MNQPDSHDGDELDAILDGIDKTETEYENGWWETSTGAEFGAMKKAEIAAYTHKQTEQVLERIKREQFSGLHVADEVSKKLYSEKSEPVVPVAAIEAELKRLKEGA